MANAATKSEIQGFNDALGAACERADRTLASVNDHMDALRDFRANRINYAIIGDVHRAHEMLKEVNAILAAARAAGK